MLALWKILCELSLSFTFIIASEISDNGRETSKNFNPVSDARIRMWTARQHMQMMKRRAVAPYFEVAKRAR